MSTNKRYDYIVIGVGGIGSAALYWLSRNAPGKKVLGIEQFKLGHLNGGSQDVSRITRMMYPEDYFAKLARETFNAWDAVERESGLQLVHKTGGIYWTTPETGQVPIIESCFYSTKGAGQNCEMLSGPQIRARWPQLTVPDNAIGVYDPYGGLVDAALANSTHQQLAECRGAEIVQNTKVVRIENRGPGDITVHTEDGRSFDCSKVIVSAGAWLNDVLKTVGCHIPVKVSQENVSYFATKYLKYFTKERCPIMIHPCPGLDVYTLPIHVIGGFKIGLDAAGPAVTADSRTFVPDPVREKIMTEFVEKYVPKAAGRIIETKTCLYTMTLDRLFVIDDLRRSGNEDVIVCCGAGHAFKFASLFGKILSELAISGSTQYDISKFTLDRPAITDPNFKPCFSFVATHQPQAKL